MPDSREMSPPRARHRRQRSEPGGSGRPLTPLPDPPHKTEKLRSSTIRGMLVMSASSAGQAVLQLVFLAVLARLVTPAEFGLSSGALIVLMLAVAVAESGVGQAIIQRATLSREHLRVGWTLSVMIGVVCWGVLFALAPMIESALRLPGLTPILRAVAFVFVINSLTLSDFLLSRRLQFDRLALAELAGYAVGNGAVAITLALLGFGPWAIVWGWLAQAAVRNTLVTFLAPFPYRPSLRWDVAKELLNFGGGLTLGRIAIWAANQMDTVVVGRYLGAAALGLYSRACLLVQVPANVFGQVANEVLFPALSAVQNDLGKLRRVFAAGIGLMAAVALPVSLLAAITSESLVLVVLGPDWLELRVVFDVIIFGLVFRTTSKLMDALVKARGAVYRRAVRSIVYAVMVMVGAYVGTHWGLHGAAIGVFLAIAGNYVYSAQLCVRLIEMSWRQFAAAHLPALEMCLVTGVTGLAADRLVAPLDLPVLVHLVLVWALAVAACLLTVRFARRTRLLAPVATLVSTLLSFLPGKVRGPLLRVVGPGYRRAAVGQ